MVHRSETLPAKNFVQWPLAKANDRTWYTNPFCHRIKHLFDLILWKHSWIPHHCFLPLATLMKRLLNFYWTKIRWIEIEISFTIFSAINQDLGEAFVMSNHKLIIFQLPFVDSVGDWFLVTKCLNVYWKKKPKEICSIRKLCLIWLQKWSKNIMKTYFPAFLETHKLFAHFIGFTITFSASGKIFSDYFFCYKMLFTKE